GHSRSQNGVLRTPMPVLYADATRSKRRWERCASEAAAWIAGSRPGMTKGQERTKKIGGETPTDARLFCRGFGHGRCPHPDPPPLAGEGMGGGSTSIGVPPRFSPQGVFHRKGRSLRP